MVNKTLITNSTLVEIMKNIFTENDFDIAIQGVNNKKAFMTEALEYLDYQIFVRDSNWFHSLSDEKQTEIRNVLHSIRLVHK
jgi:hypothetical protein